MAAERPRSELPATAPEVVRASALDGFAIAARDGDVGRVEDVYFDDESWTVRGLVVDTGGWLSGRRVVVSPAAVTRLHLEGRRLEVSLGRAQVEASPPFDRVRPVSRQYEVDLHAYYGWPFYWLGPYRWGQASRPGEAPAPGPRPVEVPSGVRRGGDPTLRSARAVSGYAIGATDGRLGHVVDFLIEAATWAVRYLIVDPRSWWPGPHVLVSTEWVTGVSWFGRVVRVDLSREEVRGAPRYDPSRADRAYERRLHAHYKRRAYWDRPDDDWRRPPAAS